MFVKEAPVFVKDFIEEMSLSLKALPPYKPLSTTQKIFLSFCIMGILMTNTVCWKRFEKGSLKAYTSSALSWMFRHSPIPWQYLLHVAVNVILSRYSITSGVLVFDDSDNKRAKTTTRIYKAHRVHDKKTNGYFNGQSIVFSILVTDTVSIPVGFRFYIPNPLIVTWNKENKRLKDKGIAKKHRPKKPRPDPEFPTKQELGLQLIDEFIKFHPQVKVKAAVADALYGTGAWTRQAEYKLQTQIISQIKNNQKVRFMGKKMEVKEFFRRYPGVPQKLTIRGGQEITVWVSGARLYLQAHKTKRFLIALKYEGETEYRYIVATDLSWRTMDILQVHTLRWLIEVFLEDFKGYEGWTQLAKQPGEEGSKRSLSLSLLLDLCLLSHPEQEARLKNKLPACTVGSLREKARAEGILNFLESFSKSPSPQQRLAELHAAVDEVFVLNESSKHMNARVLGRQEPTPSLHHKRNRRKIIQVQSKK